MTWSIFLKHRDDQYENLNTFIKHMKSRQTPITYIQCDKSGENNYFHKLVKENGFNIKFEFTSPHTPQQNCRVERKFAIMYRYMRTILNQAQLTDTIKQKLWAEAAQHSTNIRNAICTPNNPIPPYKRFHGQNPPYVNHLHVFGELVVTSDHLKFLAKSSDRGMLALYIGRAKDHANDTYMWVCGSSYT
jgi:hypothetical protein